MARRHPVSHQDVQEFVAVVDAAVGIGHEQAVGVAVERDAEVGAGQAHFVGEVFGVGRPHAVVDVEAVGLVADGHDLGAEFVEDMRGNVVGGAVSAIDQDSQALEIEFGREGALAKLDVTTGGVVEAARFS
ncbi:hypothetical protein SDC9_205311 [bioreactor metagenome]|uniref:Uncharacterized protein n=1 Tax=bioreactor metagenome TaxID=1076179 RepID=A0A645J2J2_9ZZZZ